MSRKRHVCGVMPIGENGSRSITPSSPYSTPRSRSACSGPPPPSRRRTMRSGGELGEVVVAPRDKARARRGRSTEEIEQEPRGAPEVANQAEVLLVRHIGQREVVVDAGNRLHAPAVAMREPQAIDRL